MRSDLQFKLLSHLNNKKQESGFTLIELLVVVIIIGVLAAVALPNLLKQVGKARETEIKNAAGTVNRAQQAYHFERQNFASGLTYLGITVPTEYITNGDPEVDGGLGIAPTVANGDGSDPMFLQSAGVTPENTNFENDGTRAYSARIQYANGTYAQVLCQSNNATNILEAPTEINVDTDGNLLLDESCLTAGDAVPIR